MDGLITEWLSAVEATYRAFSREGASAEAYRRKDIRTAAQARLFDALDAAGLSVHDAMKNYKGPTR